MNVRRLNLVGMAFAVLDKTGDGQVTIDDLKGVYDTSKHPDVISGKITEDEALVGFMGQWDGMTGKDGIVTKAEFAEYYRDVSVRARTGSRIKSSAWAVQTDLSVACGPRRVRARGGAGQKGAAAACASPAWTICVSGRTDQHIVPHSTRSHRLRRGERLRTRPCIAPIRRQLMTMTISSS